MCVNMIVKEKERREGVKKERERQREILPLSFHHSTRHGRVNINPDTLTNVESTGAKVALLTKKGEVVTVKSTTLSISHSLQVRL